MSGDKYLTLGQGEKHYFSLPEGWDEVRRDRGVEETATVPTGRMARDAVARPAGGVSLAEIVPKAKRVAVIVDDATRPTPVAQILEVLLPYLVENGCSRDRITLVIALGTHARLDKEVLEARLGLEVASGYTVVQHNAWQDDLVPVVVPGEERPVRINPAVAAADVRIGISSILPHPMAGYGGGPKILMPGVCDFEFIKSHHMRLTIDPLSRAGLAEGNPFQEACMRIARAIGLDFSLDCVYDREGQLVRIIGGSLEGAFAEAVDACFRILGERFEEKVDVTITSTYPHTHGIQFSKGLTAPDVITAHTGAILAVAPLTTPMPADFLEELAGIREKSCNKPMPYIRDIMSKGMTFVTGKTVEFNMAMYALLCRPPIRTILVSPGISERDARMMGLEHAASLDEGLRTLEKQYRKARVAVFPSGGLLIPITSWGGEVEVRPCGGG